MQDSDLAKTGIPYNLWRCDNPGVPSIDATEAYLSGTNMLIPASQDHRTKRMAWLAQHLGDQMNRYYRLPWEHKRKEPTPLLVDGTEVSFPFTVRLIGVKALVDLFKACDRDDERDFREEVCRPDFYFLSELGDELEYPNSFGVRVVREFFLARDDEELPTVVSLAKPPSKVLDKNGEKVYFEFSAYLETATKLVVVE